MVRKWLPSAYGNRTLHFRNLNRYIHDGYPATQMERSFWMVDREIYDEFLNILPPVYVPQGFRVIEKLTGNLAAHYLAIGQHYWCAYLDTSEPDEVVKMIRRIRRNYA